VRASCPLIIKDGQDAHPTKLGNLFFGVPLVYAGGLCLCSSVIDNRFFWVIRSLK
jgi:hypothetical protein